MPDREKVIKALECSTNGAVHCFDNKCYYHEPGCSCDREQIMLDALVLLTDQPEIVHCKNCQNFDDGWCTKNEFVALPPDWFCADGERKEGR